MFKNKKLIIFLTLICVLSISLNIGLINGKSNLVINDTSKLTVDTNKLIKGFSWRPFISSLSLEDTLEFVPIKDSYSLESLEFKLWSKHNGGNWEVVVPFSKWPLRKMTFDKTGLYDIQIDVRSINDKENVQKIYLGQFYIHDKDRIENSDYLIRKLLAGHSKEISSIEDTYKSLANELNLSLHMLYWEYKNVSVEKQKQDLIELTGIKMFDEIDNGIFKIQMDNGNITLVDLNNKKVTTNSMTLDINLTNYPNIEEIFNNLNQSSKDLNIVSAITYLLYVNYDYSQVPFELERPRIPFHTTIAHCGHYSEELYNILNYLNYPVKVVNIKHNGNGIHSLNEVKVDGNIYTLDATSGVFYENSIEKIIDKGVAPIILPQIRDLSVLYSSDMWENFESSNIEKSSGNW